MQVPGDFREIQGTMWLHDHRFSFTASNIYKGSFGMINIDDALFSSGQNITVVHSALGKCCATTAVHGAERLLVNLDVGTKSAPRPVCRRDSLFFLAGDRTRFGHQRSKSHAR